MPLPPTAQDRGSAGTEWAGLLVVAAAVLLGLGTLMPEQTLRSTSGAICRLFMLDGCPRPEDGPGTDGPRADAKPDPPSPPPQPTGACMLKQQTKGKEAGFQITLYTRDDGTLSSQTINSDGSINLSEKVSGKNGFALDFKIDLGQDAKGGGGIGAGGAFNYRWVDESAAQFNFPNQAVRDEYLRRTDEVVKALLFGGDKAVLRYLQERGVSPWRMGDAKFVIADDMKDMGVTYTRNYTSGNEAFLKASVSAGPYSAAFGYTEKQGFKGVETYVDPKDPSKNTTTYSYQSGKAFSLSVGLSGDPWSANGGSGAGKWKAGVGAGPEYEKAWDDSSSWKIVYDAAGNPVKLVISKTSDEDLNLTTTAGPGGKRLPVGRGPHGMKTPTWAMGADGSYAHAEGSGRQQVTETTVPLNGDRDVAELLRQGNIMSVVGGDQAKVRAARERLAALLRDNSSTTVRVYDKVTDKDGVDVSVRAFGVKVGGYKDQKVTQTFQLVNAFYIDSRNGDRIPWTNCTGGPPLAPTPAGGG
ncbi:hypothetical protein [Actinomadura hibisca]|uniref:hypothetical protein n=1 Tax=Actinomadura hibisca TaxID=68565 RepID=UPI000A92433A|nr:hypothetical protein [Actinomadura hibisca]